MTDIIVNLRPWTGTLAVLAALLLPLGGCPEPEPEDDDDTIDDGDDDTTDEIGGEIEAVAVLDFGYQEVGTEGTLAFEIRNAGFLPLEIYAVSVTGIEAGIFTADFDQPATLPPQEPSVYVYVPVSFTPGEAIPYGATLEVQSSDHRYEPGDPYVVDLSGTGIVDADGDG